MTTTSKIISEQIDAVKGGTPDRQYNGLDDYTKKSQKKKNWSIEQDVGLDKMRSDIRGMTILKIQETFKGDTKNQLKFMRLLRESTNTTSFIQKYGHIINTTVSVVKN